MTLSDLPGDVFATMWKQSFSRDRSGQALDMVLKDLIEYSQWYSEDTLRQELKQSLRVRVIIERKGAWGLPAVPIMRVEGAWSDEHLDAYWQAFCKFCRWPRLKNNARLEVWDSNPSLGGDEARRLILFYRSDLQRLTVWAIPDDRTLSCKKQVEVVSLRELCEAERFDEAAMIGID